MKCMCTFLPEAVKEKTSSDVSNDNLICGLSSMQGWRRTQEDAYNCILDFDVNTSFFAVYDGHLGHEVANYCSQNLPDFLKHTQAYGAGDVKQALEDTFLGIDAKIAEEALKVVADNTEKITNVKQAGDEDNEEITESEGSEEENMYDLYEEASMPIEQVMEKYVSKSSEVDSKKHRLKVQKSSECPSSSGSSSSSHTIVDVVSSSSNVKSDVDSSSIDKSDDCEAKEVSKKSSDVLETRVDSPDSSDVCSKTTRHTSNNHNGEVESSQADKTSSCEDVTSSSMPHENGTVPKKGKGKALMKTKGMQPPKIVNTRPKRNTRQLYKKLLDFEEDTEEDEESEDESDRDFVGPNDESSDDDDNEAIINTFIDGLNSDEDSSTEDEEDNTEDFEEDEDRFGFSSGSTAVVAIIKDKELYVANAGDSRCVVCRNGKAVEMSCDHKPEDERERERIVRTGGEVTTDGRLKHHTLLNLSRAIGDHIYKQNEKFSQREQMITALPEIRTLTLAPNEDEFILLASDGVWNSLDNQQAVDFIRHAIQKGKKLSTICEEMFDKCLALKGTDNMTAIIIQFKTISLKRPSEDDARESDCSKKMKTEDTVESTVT